MPDVRTLPIPASHREFTILVSGREMPRQHQLVSASVVLVANRIASARLVFVDGAAAIGEFSLSSSNLLVPGAAIEVLAGSGDSSASLFRGIVVRHAVRARERSSPQLIVECRHRAVRLTTRRRDAVHVDVRDSDIIETLLGNAEIRADVETTSTRHGQIVQFHDTDWDFLLARAEANGMLVLPDGDGLAVRRPSMGGRPACTLLFGATLLELDAEIDARDQRASVVGLSWDPAQQALVEAEGDAPPFQGVGDLDEGDLAAAADTTRVELRHAALPDADLRAIASATWARARLNKVSGRCACEGLGTVRPGDIVALDGVSTRFNGDVLVTGVRHECDLVRGWRTHLQFGGVETLASIACSSRGAPSAAPASRVHGLQIGVVVSNEDPEGEHRVRVRLPILGAEDDGLWARVASPDAGDNRGFFFRPEIGDEVVVGFADGDPRAPIILGMLASSAKPPPLAGSDQNHEKVLRTRSGLQVSFNDDTTVLRLETPAGNAITLSDDEQSIAIVDQHGSSILMSADGVTIESAKSLTLKAGTEIVVESSTALAVKAGTELSLEGSTKAELASGATTKVVGAMVQIN